jgi:Y-X(10)_GDL-associated radical SAM protein
MNDRLPPRISNQEERRDRTPLLVVWELTLACDLRCRHCGSRAGKPRPGELTTTECLEVIDRLAAMGTREISLIGGEAYLRRDLPTLVRAIAQHGIYCGIQTGGRNFTPARMEAVVDAGLQGLGVSLDGLRELHDWLRGVNDSFAAAVSTLRRAKALGLRTSVNTQIGAQTMRDLPGLLDVLVDLGVTHWQVQLTVAMGNAADNHEVLLQPHQLAELMPLLLDLYQKGLERGVLLEPGNNIGYFGPYEHIWREATEGRPHWSGCMAGETALGLEANGTIKGCPSLATVRYRAGNIRDVPIDVVWRESPRLTAVRPPVEAMSGFCGTCYYADVCSAGCTWTTDSLLGHPGNNPYCHYRVLELADQGLRERVVKDTAASPLPFGTGQFRIVLEDSAGNPVDPMTGAADPHGPPPRGSVAAALVSCGSCRYFIRAGETSCPFCGADVELARQSLAHEQQQRERAMAKLTALVAAASAQAGSGDTAGP